MRKAEAYRRVAKICLALPEAVNKPFGGHTTPCYRVNDKIFCGTRQAQRPGINVKAPPGVQQALVGSDPKRFYVPPYSGPKGWVGAWLDIDQNWDEIAELIEESYRLIAPRKLVAELDARCGSPETRASAMPRRARSTRPARRSR
jgi:predicted DNA-binding protein (MmcQ/YjbR family)